MNIVFGKKKIGRSESGQTSIEYILMIAVIIAVLTTFFSELNRYLLEGPDSFQGRYLDSYRRAFGIGNGSSSGSYRFFTVRK